ncbi:DUF4350 domain-containing protein [Planctomyces sp. SH-PL62]|uniref:DUF4350 domain-containing protein n=1 Tax=Planctomyces sp. SH-PL62 TaxID=1636152 RepID=UPI00078E0FFE|nr:DUF4350 domain-containing protein [Planctomyces sp. SH-PL62]AMV38236.1 hypothetical protein VT85_12415 [Planctomyces sp. SH-PL62]
MDDSKRRGWLLPAILAASVLALASLGERLKVSYRTPLSGCAYDNGTGGASGLYRWCARMGLPATLLEVPIAEASETLPSPSGNVVITMGDGPWSPADETMEPEGWRPIRDWLERGNSLIVVTGAPRDLPEPLRKDLFSDKLREVDPAVSALPNAASTLLGRSVDDRPETVESSVTDDGSLTIEREGPRWASAGGDERSRSVPVQLAGDARGGVLYRIPVGLGSCYVLLDPFAWANAGLDSGENARVLAAILGREIGGGSLAIDEYRHGHGRAESFLTYLLGLPGAPAFLWLALAWALLYYYGRNVRLRPAERYEGPERRTAQEYIDAVAQLHERARAAPLAVEAVAARLRHLVSASGGHDPSAAALLEAADAYVRSGSRPAAPREAVRLVAGLVQLRKRLYGTRTVS